MFATGFSMDVGAVAETTDGPTHASLTDTARAAGVFMLAGVVTLAPDGRGRNEAVAFPPTAARGLATASSTRSPPAVNTSTTPPATAW